MLTAIFFLIPATSLLYVPLAFEEFEQPKAFALIAFACFAAFWVNWRKILYDRVALGLFLFALSAAISTWLSIDIHMSMFGNVKCRNGLIVVASYLIFYLAGSKSIKDKNSAIKMVDIILLSTAIIVIYAICQALGIDFKQWSGTMTDAGYTRPMSFLGHPNFMANYLAMTLPFCIWRMENIEDKQKKVILRILFLGIICAIWLSLSRGMILSACIGMLVYFLSSREDLKKAITLMLAASFLVITTLSISPRLRHEAKERMSVLLNPGPARIVYPQTAIKIWKTYPWFGIGTDAFEIGFDNRRSPAYWNVEPGGSPHRAHNDFLNILATQGLFGGIAAILLTAFVVLRLKRSRSPFLAPCASAIAAFYVAGLTGFMLVSTTIVFLLSVILVEVT